METGPCFNDPHPANKRVDMALVDVAATTIVVVGLMRIYDLLMGAPCPHDAKKPPRTWKSPKY